jgi:predicted ATP-binding protein involved in virulence
MIDRRKTKELNGAVVIDSVDYKLEPAVLRKLLEVLKTEFPHRQFFLSAKSAEAFKNLKDIMLYSL